MQMSRAEAEQMLATYSGEAKVGGAVVHQPGVEAGLFLLRGKSKTQTVLSLVTAEGFMAPPLFAHHMLEATAKG